MQISHQDIKAYLLNNTTSDLDKQIKKLRDEDLSCQLLFEILDIVKRKVALTDKDTSRENITFSQMEDMLLDVISGTIDQHKAEILLKAICQSEGNYNRLLVKIKNLAPSLSKEPVPELENVTIKSADEMLAQILDIPCDNKRRADKPGKLLLVWNKIKNISLFEQKYYPRYAFAALLLIIITAGSYFGISYYNTTYQMDLASNLLKENYRIYMSDTPRLSGGYGSTGISTILSAEEDSESYLERAAEYSARAMRNDPGSDRARRIRAQICIINNHYTKADSILNSIEQKTAGLLNDMGVINFLKEDLPGAERYFKLSIQKDNTFKEAYYNLAITRLKSGDNNTAEQYLREYLTLEDDEGWRNAALNLLEQCK
jgi:hypothetical protein